MSVTIVRRGIEQTDLRALAERTLYLESSRMTMPTPGDAAVLAESAPVLARAVLTLLTSLEAAERERDSLRLELQANEYNRIKGNESLLAEKKAAEQRAERLQIELDDAKERYQILAREAARVVDGACISESMQDLRDTLRALEGLEEKPNA